MKQVERQLLIVCGAGRSGTSVLAGVLNAHPLVCIGLERYKFRCYSGSRLDPDLFEKDRFFNFHKDDTNIVPEANVAFAELYASLQQKWDFAQIVGDKIPHAFFWMNEIEAAYPKVRFLYILRDIEAVAASWNARALNEHDRGWPRDYDYRKAVKVWNAGNKRVLEKVARCPRRIQVIDYDRFFSGLPAELERVSSFLELPIHSMLSEAFAYSAQINTSIIASRQKRLDPEQRNFVQKNANMENYWCLIASSVEGPIW